jgi:Exostosin family
MIHNDLFYCKNKDTYPPFKNGLYLEEYFLNKIMNDISLQTANENKDKKKYIPALWTNFQIESWFQYERENMQAALDKWVDQNPSDYGYFTIVQYDDGPLLRLPPNTIVYGACSGDIPIPLIYQDVNDTLVSYASTNKKSFHEKSILCSFVGNITANHVQPNVRQIMFDALYHKSDNFCMINSGGWTASVNENLQQVFIVNTINSKFALAPRGYGRGSFRFFECFQLGTIPIYIWNDVNWLPFQDVIDYKRLCVCIHISEIETLENILLSIDEVQYNAFFEYYNEIKHLFDLEGMCNHIICDLFQNK